MKSFDQEQDMDFQIGGETFTMRVVRPEVLAAWEATPESDSGVDALKLVDERILVFLADGNGQHDKWKALREREDDAVAMWQLRELLEWMVEVQSVRPTETPSPSARGRGKIAASSTAE